MPDDPLNMPDDPINVWQCQEDCGERPCFYRCFEAPMQTCVGLEQNPYFIADINNVDASKGNMVLSGAQCKAKPCESQLEPGPYDTCPDGCVSDAEICRQDVTCEWDATDTVCKADGNPDKCMGGPLVVECSGGECFVSKEDRPIATATVQMTERPCSNTATLVYDAAPQRDFGSNIEVFQIDKPMRPETSGQ